MSTTPRESLRQSDGMSGTLADPAAPRVLLVDDHFDTVYVMSRLLQMGGFTVNYATSGDRALQLAEAETYDLVVSDLNLPGINGFALMRRLREIHEGIQGIAVSGYGVPEYAAECRAAGFAEFFSKPVDLAKLQAAIRRLVVR